MSDAVRGFVDRKSGAGLSFSVSLPSNVSAPRSVSQVFPGERQGAKHVPGRGGTVIQETCEKRQSAVLKPDFLDQRSDVQRRLLLSEAILPLNDDGIGIKEIADERGQVHAEFGADFEFVCH